MKISTAITTGFFSLLISQSVTQAAVVGIGDGLINVQLVNTSGSNPGNDTANWLSVWNALDLGDGPTGTVAGYNIVNNTSDLETFFDYAGGGNFSSTLSLGTINGDGPGGGPGPFGGGDNYSLRGRSYLEFNSGGVYTIAMGSDDGRRISLTSIQSTGYNGFTARGDQVNGAFTVNDTVIGFSGGTGHNQSVGTFNVDAGDILFLDAFMYEGGGGDSGEISIAQGAFGSFTNTSDFNLLQDGVLGGAISIHSSVMVIPEPSGFLLVAVGFVGFALRRRR